MGRPPLRSRTQDREERGLGFLPALFLTVAALPLLVVACGGNDDGSSDATPTAAASPSTVATPFILPARSPTEHALPIRIAVTLPIFEEFARASGGDNVDVISLIPPGADPHSYTLTDTTVLMGIDFFFLNGLGLDSRLKDLIESNRDETAHVIPFAPNTLSPQGGGQTAEQAGDNAHMWLDPSLAFVYVEIIVDEMDIYDGIRKDYYDANFASFRARMLDLEDEIYSQLNVIPAGRRALVTYHDSFEHFARRFDMEAVAYAVENPGDAPGDAVERLVRIVRDQGIPAVFAEHGYDNTVMSQVAAAASVPLCRLYSDIIDDGMTYEQMMRANADELVRCLGT